MKYSTLGAQITRPKDLRSHGKNVPRDKKAHGTKRPTEQNVPQTKRPKGTQTSQRTKHPTLITKFSQTHFVLEN